MFFFYFVAAVVVCFFFVAIELLPLYTVQGADGQVSLWLVT